MTLTPSDVTPDFSQTSAFLTITSDCSLEIDPIKKSRFIASAFPLQHVSDISIKIELLRKEFPNANHHCWAYRLDQHTYKFNDDGEPSGSAGKPILNHIDGANLQHILIVVTRYFGGTKLGVGGLVKAYGEAAKRVIQEANIITVTPTQLLLINHPYSLTNDVESILHPFNTKPSDIEYNEVITQHLNVPRQQWKIIIQHLKTLEHKGLKIDQPNSKSPTTV